MTTIGIIGSGPVAQAMGYLLRHAGQPIVAVSSRSAAHSAAAARFIDEDDGVSSLPLPDLARVSSHILIATADTAIPLVADQLSAASWSGTVLHLSGGAGLSVFDTLRSRGSACGVLHPLQTVASREQGITSLRGIWFAVAGDAQASAFARKLAEALAGKVLDVPAEHLSTYHAGAVMASNALTACMDAAVSLIGQAGISASTALDALGPLSRTALENALRVGPESALTGPVARADTATIRAHLAAIDDRPSPAGDLYKYIGSYLVDLARRRAVDKASLQSMGALFDDRRKEHGDQ